MRLLQVHPSYQNELLLGALRRLLGEIEPGALERVLQRLDWLELGAGELLFDEGSWGEEIYFLVSGRVQATVRSSAGREVVVARMGRGEAVGEFSLITGERRTARVSAARPSVLVRLSRAGFDELVREHPSVFLHLTRGIIERLRRSERLALDTRGRESASRPVSMAFVPAGPGVDVQGLAAALAERLPRWGRTLLLDATALWERFGAAAAAATRTDGLQTYMEVARWLDDVEAQHEFVLLVADQGDTPWTRRCLSQADEVLLVVRGDAPPDPQRMEQAMFAGAERLTNAPVRLVVLHDSRASVPAGTAALLASGAVNEHVHIRRGLDRDLDRLARIVSRNSVGLVLSGGAARGFAHLGVYRALAEAGIEFDHVGGTSMGAAIGGLIAIDLPPLEAAERFRRVLDARPVVSDYNLLPFVSLIKGRRLGATLEKIYARPDGSQPDIEDTWKSFFCIAASYSQARETVLRRGSLAKLVRASLSVPVFLPPVLHAGEALVDGALFNNFPVDVMVQSGANYLIGADLKPQSFDAVGCDEVPSGLEVLLGRWGKSAGRHLGVPTLAGLLYHVPMLASRSRHTACAGMVDLLIRLDLRSIRSGDWDAMARAVELGYRSAQSDLERFAKAQPGLFAALQGRGR